MRPIYKIILIVLVILLIIFGVWFFWKQFISKPIPNIPGTTSTLPIGGAGNGGESSKEAAALNKNISIQKLSDNPVFGFWIDRKTNEVYYLAKTGEVYSAKDGPDPEISTQTFAALNHIMPYKDGGKLLASFGDPANPSWGVFDTVDKVWRPLPQEIINASWGSNNTELFVFYKNGSSESFGIADISKPVPQYKQLIKDLRLKDTNFVFASSSQIIFYEKSSTNYPARVWGLNTKTLAFNLLINEEAGMLLRASSDGTVFFRSTTPTNFFILNRALQEIAPVVIETLPTKCDGGEITKTIFCFVPQNFTPQALEGISLPDDYLKNKLYTSDDLYTITTDSQKTTKIFQSGGDKGTFDAQNVLIANTSVYFINHYDSSLYKLTPSETK